MSDYLDRTENGTVFVGSDQDILKALTLASGLRIYAATKMLPNRGWTANKMLSAAARLTGQPYKRGQYEKAAADLTAYADKLKSLPRE